mmetsp:Transcript_87297/g.159996  ORF Transcript_87297/g.159996 Transcript_87297/m.159996 type:complete len:221 (-) Transcript_87297:93-755(-)
MQQKRLPKQSKLLLRARLQSGQLLRHLIRQQQCKPMLNVLEFKLNAPSKSTLQRSALLLNVLLLSVLLLRRLLLRRLSRLPRPKSNWSKLLKSMLQLNEQLLRVPLKSAPKLHAGKLLKSMLQLNEQLLRVPLKSAPKLHADLPHQRALCYQVAPELHPKQLAISRRQFNVLLPLKLFMNVPQLSEKQQSTSTSTVLPSMHCLRLKSKLLPAKPQWDLIS